MMNFDSQKIDDAVLALLTLESFDNGRSWKGYSFDTMDRLYEKGLISSPKGHAKSVVLSAKGLERGNHLAQAYFAAE